MIPPTLKVNKRYIAFSVVAKQRFTEKQVLQAMRQSVLSFVGERGYAQSNFDIVYYDNETMVGVARATDLTLDSVILSLSLVDSIQGRHAGVLVTGVSGTVKKAMRKLFKENIFKGDTTQ